ncbi:hypothetical protein ECG_06573 [Echinococcus granulosus]|uniref:L antigen family member 3 n=1 Tax=Echinococcus granulosus TaxID=6210 RepID=A0A068WNY4_ECHGR|nr:hypothetical protein ECG_06573 [Echinococcus granulosus]CDS19337.1 L antigen family [Echinococcus granulosus]
MSFASRVTFAVSCVATVGIIAYVHIEQALERERISATVREEIEATKALIRDRIEKPFKITMQQALKVRVPFPTKSAAEIAFRSLRVDAEPQRSTVSVQLSVEENFLCAKFTADTLFESNLDSISQLKKLRITINHWLDSIFLICETMAEFGDPPADMPEPMCAITGNGDA